MPEERAVSVLAHFEPLDEALGDRRRAPRLLLTLGSELESCGSSVTIQDLSSTGLSFETSTNLAIGETIEVRLPEMDAAKAIIVRREGCLFACTFERPISKAAVSAALLRSEPSSASSTKPRDAQDSESYSARGFASRSRLWGSGVAAAVAAGIAYLVITGAWTTLIAVAAVSAVVFALLVKWGLWALDNTFDIGLR